MSSNTSRRPDASTIALLLSIGLALYVGGVFFVRWLNQPTVVEVPDFNVAETRRSVVFVKCLTPGLPPSVGSGFLVSSDGLIYTNRHVVQPDYPIQGSIILVGVPKAKEPQELDYFQADLVYAAPAKDALDFAVLKITAKPGYGPFNPVPLSPASLELGENVAVFGYPFITSDQHVMTITRGIVSATRVVLEQHPYYQTDAAVNPGNSGGPLINLRGEVVGIVTLRKANANNMGYALYLKEIQLPAALARNRATELKPLAGPLDPDKLPRHPALPPEAWEVARGKKRIERGSLALENDGDAYWATTRDDLPRNFQVVMNCQLDFLKGTRRINNTYQNFFRTLYVRFGTADIGLDIMDRKLGTRVEFSSLHSYLWQQDKLLARDDSGGPDDLFVLTVTRQAGAISVAVDQEIMFFADDDAPQTPSAKLSVGGYLSKLRLDEVNIIELFGDRKPTEINKRDMPKDIVASAAPRLIDVKPPLLSSDAEPFEMPAKIADLDVGGAGRYFVLHFPTRSELAIFDVNEAKIVRTIPLKEAGAKFAAGLDKLLVVLPQAKQIERWDLATGFREQTAPLELKPSATLAVLGSASRGPLLIGAGEGPLNTEFAFVNVDTLKPMKIKLAGPSRPQLGKNVQVRASAEGAVFAFCEPGNPAHGLTTLVLAGNEARGYHIDSRVRYAVPGPDGQIIFTDVGRFTQDARQIGIDKLATLPAHQGVYSLGIQDQSVTVRLAGDDRVLPQAPKDLLAGVALFKRGDLAADKRVSFVPGANVIVTIPDGDDRLVLHRFNADEALEKSGLDYLIVTSVPPNSFRRGATYRYPIEVKSRPGGLEYRVIAGPKGVEVSKTGLVTWPVPRDFADPEREIVIGVGNSRQELRHTFKVTRRD